MNGLRERSVKGYHPFSGGTTRSTNHSYGQQEIVRVFRQTYGAYGEARMNVEIRPMLSHLPKDWELVGEISIIASQSLLEERSSIEDIEVVCRARQAGGNSANFSSSRAVDSFVFHVTIVIEVLNIDQPVVSVFFHPRAFLVNLMPLSLIVRSPMPYILGSELKAELSDTFDLLADSYLEIFTPGPSIAVVIKCRDLPVGGSSMDWMDSGWVELPLLPEFRLHDPVKFFLPLERRPDDLVGLSSCHGSEFFIAEGRSALAKLPLGLDDLHAMQVNDDVEVLPKQENDDWRSFYVTVCNYAIDHTGSILIEQVQSSASSIARRSLSDISRGRISESLRHWNVAPFGAFKTNRHRGRISLLPSSSMYIRLLHLTMEGDHGMRKSSPFRIDDIAISDGGVGVSPILWENGDESGYFAYRKLLNSHQSELHIVPEYVVYNGSENNVISVRQPGDIEMKIEPNNIHPLRTHGNETVVISIHFTQFNACTSPLRVDSLGLRIAVVKTLQGNPIGSVAIQTVVGSTDSRLVVKVGDVKVARTSVPTHLETTGSTGILQYDLLRFRLQCSEFSFTLKEARPIVDKKNAYMESAFDKLREIAFLNQSPISEHLSSSDQSWIHAREQRAERDLDTGSLDGIERPSVCTFIFKQCTIDFQRVFKEVSTQTVSVGDVLVSPERAQISLIVHNVQLRDEAPGSSCPVVLDSSSASSFFDLCIRTRGPLTAELVRVDLFDLNIAHANGMSQKIFVNTSESFVWKTLDLADRILSAAGEFAGVEMNLKWDDKSEGYMIVYKDQANAANEAFSYSPPQSDKLYDVRKVRVSPFSLVVSFKREPLSSRYKVLRGVRGANVMNYFTRQLKFTVENAELAFAK
jgi:hypothetical protein